MSTWPYGSAKIVPGRSDEAVSGATYSALGNYEVKSKGPGGIELRLFGSLRKLKIDDPVGATSVHLLNGIFGTLAAGFFYNHEIAKTVAGLTGDVVDPAKWSVGQQVMVQLKGIVAIGGFTFVASLVLWYILKLAGGIRVSREEEIMGLDVGEHGNEAYADFQEVNR
ncbi:MAG TPA: hypothetical protein PKC74_07640, partial [Turneriella sp.]|nr:hypothetical protein [Turneriella sp.]